MAETKEITIYTDGACLRNPNGPGGYGVVLKTLHGGEIYRRELSQGYSNTTNNRMELLAVIVALESLKFPSRVKLYSDSRYVVNAFSEGWAQNWKRYGWYKSPNGQQRPKNIDLWKRALEAAEPHEVEFNWVKGHVGIEENERCDALATEAALAPDLIPDLGDEEEGPQLLF